ncbi:MAG: DUF1415 domain-containing protein [Congregibacter sp.]
MTQREPHSDNTEAFANTVVAATKTWIYALVVDLNLCPFARKVLENDSVRFAVTEVNQESELLAVLDTELERMHLNPEIETAFLIHPRLLRDFHDYNQFLTRCDRLLVAKDLEGVFQIASFHPHYQFACTDTEDAENYSNRSPHPMLHILRESSVAQAVASHPDADGIPHRNIQTLNALGATHLEAFLRKTLNA